MRKYKEAFNYILFGGLTTLTNIISYYICVHTFQMDYKVSTTIAWILSVLFAYVTNKLFVFNSKTIGFQAIMKELLMFFFFRILSFFLDLGLMVLLVGALVWNDLIAKILTNVFVVIFNYIASKVFIFKKQDVPR
ncbi:MAG: GtrA family protein [Bacillus sp. (in: firmicutes)]